MVCTSPSILGPERRTTGGTETTGDDADEVAVHRAAHDIAQDCAATADQRTGNDQQVVGQHEAGCGRGPAGITVEHGNDDRHVGAADGSHHVHAEHQGQQRHRQQQQGRLLVIGCTDELDPDDDDGDQNRQVEPVTCRQHHRLAADDAAELAIGDDRTGKGQGADTDTDIDLDFMYGFFDTKVLDRCIEKGGKTDQHRGQTDQAVQDRDQLRHLRHLHAPRQEKTDHTAGDHERDQPLRSDG